MRAPFRLGYGAGRVLYDRPVRLCRNAKIELLSRTPLFAGCSKRELGQIAAIADEIHHPLARS